MLIEKKPPTNSPNLAIGFISDASWWIITLKAALYVAADVLIRDVFGSLWFVKRCSSGANWQACSDFIVTGKHSAFLPPHWKCQRRGAVLSNSYWNVVMQSQWLIWALNTSLRRTSKRGAWSNPLHTAALIRIIVITNVLFFFKVFLNFVPFLFSKERNESMLCLNHFYFFNFFFH